MIVRFATLRGRHTARSMPMAEPTKKHLQHLQTELPRIGCDAA